MVVDLGHLAVSDGPGAASIPLGAKWPARQPLPSVTSLCIWIGKGGWRHTVCFVLKPRFVPCVYTVLLALGDSRTLARKCSRGGRPLWFIAWSTLRRGLESKRLHSSVGLGLRPLGLSSEFCLSSHGWLSQQCHQGLPHRSHFSAEFAVSKQWWVQCCMWWILYFVSVLSPR